MFGTIILQCLEKKPFPELEGLSVHQQKLTVTTTLLPPWNRIELTLSPTYITRYPIGEVFFVLEDRIHVLRDNAPHPLPDVLRHLRMLLETTQASPAPSMSMVDAWSSWAMEPTFEVSPTPLGENLRSDIGLTAQHRVTCEVSDRGRSSDVCVVVHVPLTPTLADITAKSWGLNDKEPLLLAITTQRESYPMSAFAVEVTQPSHPAMNRMLYQIRSVVESFLREWCAREKAALRENDNVRYALISEGYPAQVVEEVLRNQGDNTSIPQFQAAAQKAMGLTAAPSQRALPPREVGLLVAIQKYVIGRLSSLSEFCVICDRPHASGSKMVCSAVCMRTECMFRAQQLGVGIEAGSFVSLPMSVVDLLFTFLRSAIASARWEKILQPFPTVFGSDSKEPLISDNKKNITLLREILSKVPSMSAIAQSGFSVLAQEPLAHALFQWVIDSNRSVLLPLPESDRLTFMGPSRQYILVQSSQRHAEAFEREKAALKGVSKWCFHGSRPENWHSILRNGLVNASGTPLQVNGTAHGSGVYISPKGSVSFSYSNLGSSARKADAEEEFIHPTTIRCIAICEVLEKDLKIANDIWVQPHEDCVATRFFIVFDHNMSHGYNTDLRDPTHIQLLNDVASRLCH